MSVNGPTEFEKVAAEDGLNGSFMPGEERQTDRELDSPVPEPAIQGRSLASIAWRRLRQDKVAMGGGVVIVLLILIAVFANVLQAISGQNYQTLHNSPPNLLLDPSTNMPTGFFGIDGAHWLGVTPGLGQDILLLLIFGARTSLIIAGSATALSVVLGIVFGVIAGFYRGVLDAAISRTMDVLLSFPVLLLSISLVTVVSLINTSEAARYLVIIFVLGFFGFPYLGRIVRGQVLSLREKEFVEAARSLGATNGRIMFKEIAPNLVGPILVYATLTIPNYILGEAGLSFLGVGVQPPSVSWGAMLSDAGQYFYIDPLYLLFPGAAIFISVLAFNLFGDGLRDALDPKSTR